MVNKHLSRFLFPTDMSHFPFFYCENSNNCFLTGKRSHSVAHWKSRLWSRNLAEKVLLAALYNTTKTNFHGAKSYRYARGQNEKLTVKKLNNRPVIMPAEHATSQLALPTPERSVTVRTYVRKPRKGIQFYRPPPKIGKRSKRLAFHLTRFA